MTTTPTEAPAEDDGRKAQRVLGEVLCRRLHGDLWMTPETWGICPDCLAVSADVLANDWLRLLTGHREQKAKAEGMREARDAAAIARPVDVPAADVAPILAAIDSVAEMATPLEPVTPDEPQPEPADSGVTPATEAQALQEGTTDEKGVTTVADPEAALVSPKPGKGTKA